jgi:hypothetical protein
MIVISLFLGYTGVNKITNNDANIEILDIDIDVSNKSGKREGYIYVGLAVLVFLGGVKTLNSK